MPTIACDVNTELKSKASDFKKFLVYWRIGNHNKIINFMSEMCTEYYKGTWDVT